MPLFDIKETAKQPIKKKSKKIETKSSLFSITPKVKEAIKIEFIKEGQFSQNEELIACRIQQLRLQMLIHSRLYYLLNYNVISDREWSERAIELRNLQRSNLKVSAKVCFAKDFEDWDGSTGAFLPLEHPWVIQKCKQLYRR